MPREKISTRKLTRSLSDFFDALVPPKKKRLKPLPGWLTAGLVGGTFVAIAIAERKRPLRRRVETPLRHVTRDVTVAGLAAAASTALQGTLLRPFADRLHRKRLGMLYNLPLPSPIRTALAVLLLDYTLWWWHWGNHRIPLLWRFHLPHHADLDLDTATAFRFHPGELSLSVFFRMLQLRLIGPDPLAISLWQTMLMMSIVFHHSNLDVTEFWDSTIRRLIVTPRMHGIHHSDFRDETDSNWSSLLSIWDFLHGTTKFDVPQGEITIGVPAWKRPADVTLGKVIAMPFAERRDDWVDSEGTPHIRRENSAPRA